MTYYINAVYALLHMEYLGAYKYGLNMDIIGIGWRMEH